MQYGIFGAACGGCTKCATRFSVVIWPIVKLARSNRASISSSQLKMRNLKNVPHTHASGKQKNTYVGKFCSRTPIPVSELRVNFVFHHTPPLSIVFLARLHMLPKIFNANAGNCPVNV